MTPAVVGIFYNGGSGSVNELDDVALSVAEVVVGGKGGAVVG